MTIEDQQLLIFST